MFVNIMQFPPVQKDRDAEFRQWFAWSNEQYARHPGFISRKLMKARKQGNYAALIEHESYETFIAMHSSPTQAAAQERLKPLLEGSPSAQFYDLVEG